MCPSNLVREKAKARYRAVKYTPTKSCVAPEGGGDAVCCIELSTSHVFNNCTSQYVTEGNLSCGQSRYR
jgi:hypothetical protein